MTLNKTMKLILNKMEGPVKTLVSENVFDKKEESLLKFYVQTNNDYEVFNSSTLDIPFPFINENVYTLTKEALSGIILYMSKDDIDDKNLKEDFTYVFFREIKNISFDIIKYTLSTYEEGDSQTKNLYVLFGNNNEENEFFDEYLTNNFYDQENDIDEEEKECAFNTFKKNSQKLSLSSYENYLSEMFKSIGYSSNTFHHVKNYMPYFYVAVTAPDVCPNEDENYELLEYLGDQVAWEVMDEIFEEYCKKNNIKLESSSFITSLHRSFSSKIVQAKLSKEMYLHNFLKSEKEITVDVREDIFEAFIGALYFVNFLIKASIGVDYKLHEKFLKWIYESMKFENFEEKPEITQFYENVKMIVGPFRFKEKKTQRGPRYMSYKPSTEELFFDSLKKDFVDGHEFDICYSETELKTILFDFFSMLKKPYANNSENLNEERTKKYGAINKYLEEKLGEDFFLKKKQERNISSWSDEQKDQFNFLIKEFNLKNFIIDKRFIDKSATDFYWVIFDFKTKKELYNTLNYSDSEDPETLFSLIRSEGDNLANIDVKNIEIVKCPKNHVGDYLVKISTKEKFIINGNSKSAEEHLKNIMAKTPENNFSPDWEYYIKVESEDYEKFEEIKYFKYSPYHEIKFNPKFNIDFIRDKLKNRNLTEYPRHIYRFFGDRLAYGHVSLLAMSRHKVRDEHNMTVIKNFLRSKSFKDEITKVLGIHENDDPSLSLIHYDELLGMNRETAHLVIERVHSDITFSNSILHKPEIVLQKLLKTLLRAKRNRRHEGKVGLYLEKETKTYKYTDSFGKKLSVKINNHNYLQISYYFAKMLIEHEKKLEPRWNEIQNSNFSVSGYGVLENALQKLGIEEWLMGKEEKNGRKYITISFEKNERLRFYKGTSIESIMKQFDFM